MRRDHLDARLAVRPSLDCFGALVLRQLRAAAELHAVGSCASPALAGSLTNQLSFELDGGGAAAGRTISTPRTSKRLGCAAQPVMAMPLRKSL
jgi:hypothetical protein